MVNLPECPRKDMHKEDLPYSSRATGVSYTPCNCRRQPGFQYHIPPQKAAVALTMKSARTRVVGWGREFIGVDSISNTNDIKQKQNPASVLGNQMPNSQ